MIRGSRGQRKHIRGGARPVEDARALEHTGRATAPHGERGKEGINWAGREARETE